MLAPATHPSFVHHVVGSAAAGCSVFVISVLHGHISDCPVLNLLYMWALSLLCPALTGTTWSGLVSLREGCLTVWSSDTGASIFFCGEVFDGCHSHQYKWCACPLSPGNPLSLQPPTLAASLCHYPTSSAAYLLIHLPQYSLPKCYPLLLPPSVLLPWVHVLLLWPKTSLLPTSPSPLIPPPLSPTPPSPHPFYCPPHITVNPFIVVATLNMISIVSCTYACKRVHTCTRMHKHTQTHTHTHTPPSLPSSVLLSQPLVLPFILPPWTLLPSPQTLSSPIPPTSPSSWCFLHVLCTSHTLIETRLFQSPLVPGCVLTEKMLLWNVKFSLVSIHEDGMWLPQWLD